MFKRAIRWQRRMPNFLSSDNDPLYRFHQWLANLRVLEVTAIKTVPYVPLSHPFVERLIGTLSTLEERRTARRYKLALQVEIRLESNIKEFQPILGRTRDISSRGFYFRISQSLSVEMRIEFSIMPPWEATHAFISGQARVIRVEEVSESGADRVGVGAAIGRYKFGQTESPRRNFAISD